MSSTNYPLLLADIKIKIREAQVKALLSANAQMIQMYWDIGNMIANKQKIEGWGANVIAKLSADLKSELPELRGFSERNLKNMLRFASEYSFVQLATAQLESDLNSKVQQPVAQLQSTEIQNDIKVQQPVAQLQSTEIQNDIKVQQPVAQLNEIKLLLSIPWSHNVILIEKIKDLKIRLWYINQIIENGWSREILSKMIKSNLHERTGSTVNNFDDKLTNLQASLVKQNMKDPYVFDFLTIAEPFAERELEANLIKHIEKFLLELGTGFSYVGRQYHLEVGDQDFYIDLLF